MKGKVQKIPNSRNYLILFRFIIIIFFLVMVGLFLISYFRIYKVNVEGSTFYTQKQIESKIMKSPMEKNVLSLMLKHKLMGWGEIPHIQDIEITAVSNHEIHIRIFEKQLIACINYMGEYVYFDKDGIVLESSSQKMKDVPCITGVAFDGFVLYEKIKVDNDEIFHTILNLSNLVKRYKIQGDSIHFNKKGEVTLQSGEIIVHLGKRDLYDEQLVNLTEVLKQTKKKKMKGTIDMKNYQVGKDITIKLEKTQK